MATSGVFARDRRPPLLAVGVSVLSGVAAASFVLAGVLTAAAPEIELRRVVRRNGVGASTYNFIKQSTSQRCYSNSPDSFMADSFEPVKTGVPERLFDSGSTDRRRTLDLVTIIINQISARCKENYSKSDYIITHGKYFKKLLT